MTSVFLSHSHADKSIARRLAKDLRAAGVIVWIDEAELEIGSSLVRGIGEAIDTHDFLIVLLSENSVRSEWVLREVEVALNREFADRTVRVLPLVVGDCELPPFLRGKVCADFRDPRAYQQELDKVLDRLGGAAATTTTTIVFDESYRQERWYAQPVISAGYGTVAAAVADGYTVTANAHGYSNPDTLSPRSILIFPMPFGSMVDELHYENLCKWVYRGGRLVLLGLYLMETHHYSNLNRLARRFGFEFSSNLTMPQGREDFQRCMHQAFAYTNRDFWITTKPVATPTSHPVVEDVTTLAITSSCTVDSTGPPDLLVSTADPVAVLHARGYKNPEGRLVQLTDYVLDKHASASILVALRYGAGRVVGIGSWKLFVNELVEDKHNDNLRLFRNLISWLSRDDSESRDTTPSLP
jgi:TIR domain